MTKEFLIEGFSKTGKELTCKAEYLSVGRVKTEYHVTYARDEKGLQPSLELKKAEIKKIFGVDIPTKTAFIKITNYNDYENWKKLCEEEKTEEDYKNTKITGYTYEMGCDCADTKRFEISIYSEKMRNELSKYDDIAAELLKKNPEKYSAKTIPSNLGSYGGLEVDEENVQNLLEDAKKALEIKENEKENERQKREIDKEEKITNLKKLAKETGEKQIYERYSVECNDPNEECDIDNIVVYVLPNGEFETTRNHTW